MRNAGGEHWHALPPEDAIAFFGTDRDRGLDLFEIENRTARFGRNIITERKGKSPLVRLLLQVHQPLIYILIASAVITAFLKEWVDSAVIFGIVVINAIIGFIQESKALTAVAALKRGLVSEATVVRAGQAVRISSADIVPGDIVLLGSGDKVPADLRLISTRDLQIDESVLTGESVPSSKHLGALPAETPLADRRNMVFTSTLVTFGAGKGVAIATGDRTEIGKISEMIATTEALTTPLTRKINRFSNVLLVAILALAAFTLAIGVLRGHAWFDTFMAAVALAVGAIPEGLPAAVTIILAIGVSRMAKRRTIIRRLPAVETLGSTTVICSDKTGTLTKNQMTVQEIWAGGTRYYLSGSGYDPAGDITVHGGERIGAHDVALVECLKAGMLCNDSTIVSEESQWKVHGDPTEGALMVSALKGGLDKDALSRMLPRIDVIPFESQRHYMATLHGTGESAPPIVYLKGSMERLLPHCSSALGRDGMLMDIDRNNIEREIETLATEGLRVLIFARKELPSGTSHIAERDIEDGLVFLGFQAMLDPPRPEAIDAVAACRRAGIDVKMITGDHATTAQAIAYKLGIGRRGDAPLTVLTSRDLHDLSDAEFIEAASNTDVFARTSPEHKFRLVEALQAHGHVVAMTGDGVNDAPALRRADIGVAMGRGGTEVAREASDMVITDDNFASIEAAVEEGRGVFDNLLKFIVWTLPANLGEGLVVMLAILLGITLPMTPVQILWINMTTAGCLGLMLAFEPMEADIMNRRPRHPRSPILTAPIIVRIVLVSVLLCVGSFVLYHWELADGASRAQARTVAVNVFVVGELFYLFSCRSLTKSLLSQGFFSNRWVWIGLGLAILLQILFTYTSVMNRLFNTAPFEALVWIRIIVVGSLISLAVAIDKGVLKLLAKYRVSASPKHPQ